MSRAYNADMAGIQPQNTPVGAISGNCKSVVKDDRKKCTAPAHQVQIEYTSSTAAKTWHCSEPLTLALSLYRNTVHTVLWCLVVLSEAKGWWVRLSQFSTSSSWLRRLITFL